jgi:hypothetical protein
MGVGVLVGVLWVLAGVAEVLVRPLSQFQFQFQFLILFLFLLPFVPPPSS